MSNEAFVTLATNDSYGLGALVLGRSLRRVATTKQTVVLVTPDVSQKMKDELSEVFNLVVTVDTLDSGDAAHLALMSRPELGVTFTKLHAWRLVQFSKCVFLDADTLVVQNCDELFEREELSAAPDPGWPDCFNSGVFVFVPSEATFKALLDFAVTHGSFDGGDQGLLNMFFSDWATGDIRKHLPFIYNVVSSATYSYLPALKYFGSQVKIAHFLGSNKPWLRQSQVGSSSPYHRAWWGIFREDVAGRLSQDMAGVAGVLAGGEPDEWRREAWEAGDVDYLGRDSFDNIWRRICECVGITAQTLSAPAAPAATSAGIVKQPSSLQSSPEETLQPASEKVAESESEKNIAPPSEKQAELSVASEKQEKEQEVSTGKLEEKPTEPPIPSEKVVEPVVCPEKPAEPVSSAEQTVQSALSGEKAVEPVITAPKKEVIPVPGEKPEEPAVSADKPADTAASLEKPTEVLTDKSAEPVVSSEKPGIISEKIPEAVVVGEKASELSSTSEHAPVLEKLTETPVVVASSTDAEKENKVESCPIAEKPKVVDIPASQTLETPPPGEKSVDKETPADKKPLDSVEKLPTPVETPAKTTPAEKPVESAIITQESKEVLTEKNQESIPTVERPTEVAPAAVAPVEKPIGQSPEVVKPIEIPKTDEVCPMKPPQLKSTKPETPVGGEAQIQPPLIAGDAPVCKKEPGTPTITPPSGPASPQPADVPPEVCKLQATPSQPATPPASSHQTTDAPVPPKRKQGKNGKSGKGKK